MSIRRRVLIVGGYGTFGGRLVELLEPDPRLMLIVAGRSLPRASAYCASRRTLGAELVPAAFDRGGDLAEQLHALKPDILVDASGPFQTYGDQPYRLIEACIAARISYLDLADGSEFVAGVKAFDSAARAAGVYVLAGVSSFPVLTAAVVRRLSADMARVTSIRAGIAPSPYAGVGDNVIRAIASYAGQPVRLKRNGEDVAAHPFTESVRFTIAPPGRLPLRRTLFSLVDVPDLRALAELWPEAKTIWMGAGPVPEILHRALIAFAWLVRRRLVRSLLPLAPLMSFVMKRLRWGEHRGGMFVEVVGERSDGTSSMRSWHLLAEGDDGPLIPSMAAQAIIERSLDGRPPAPGARSAARDLELGDYAALFAGRSICAGVRDDIATCAIPLYARVLGAAWSELPPQIRQVHDIQSVALLEGVCTVERGRSLLARFVALLFGFPRAGSGVDLSVRFEVKDGIERWTRTFAGRSFASRQFEGRGKAERLLCEQFGPLRFALALVPDSARLNLVLRHWSAFGVPLPLGLGPWSNSFETVEDERFRFHVEIGHRVTGLIVRYQGWIRPASEQPAANPRAAPSVSDPAPEAASSSKV
jgi:hypothetical protein